MLVCGNDIHSSPLVSVASPPLLVVPQSSSCLLFILTPRSANSDYCQDEVEHLLLSALFVCLCSMPLPMCVGGFGRGVPQAYPVPQAAGGHGGGSRTKAYPLPQTGKPMACQCMLPCVTSTDSVWHNVILCNVNSRCVWFSWNHRNTQVHRHPDYVRCT